MERVPSACLQTWPPATTSAFMGPSMHTQSAHVRGFIRLTHPLRACPARTPALLPAHILVAKWSWVVWLFDCVSLGPMSAPLLDHPLPTFLAISVSYACPVLRVLTPSATLIVLLDF